jgi:hypothetical protein
VELRWLAAGHPDEEITRSSFDWLLVGCNEFTWGGHVAAGAH